MDKQQIQDLSNALNHALDTLEKIFNYVTTCEKTSGNEKVINDIYEILTEEI